MYYLCDRCGDILRGDRGRWIKKDGKRIFVCKCGREYDEEELKKRRLNYLINPHSITNIKPLADANGSQYLFCCENKPRLIRFFLIK